MKKGRQPEAESIGAASSSPDSSKVNHEVRAYAQLCEFCGKGCIAFHITSGKRLQLNCCFHIGISYIDINYALQLFHFEDEQMLQRTLLNSAKKQEACTQVKLD